MINIALVLGSILSSLGVAIGAFGAHGLKNILEQNMVPNTFNPQLLKEHLCVR